MLDYEFREGKPLTDDFIIDAHCHIGPWYDFNAPEWYAESIVKSMDNIGIKKAVISSTLGIGPDFSNGNLLTLDIINKYPDRFVGYIVVNPNYSDKIINELDKYKNNVNMRAVKIHPTFHEYPIDGQDYRILYKYANENKMVILSHTWGVEHISAFDRLAFEYPDVKFILGHCGGTIQAVKLSIEIAKKYKNIYLDLTGSRQYDGVIEIMCSEVGSDRVLFGTDMPFVDSKSAVGRVIYSNISEHDKKNILGLNIAKLLKMEGQTVI